MTERAPGRRAGLGGLGSLTATIVLGAVLAMFLVAHVNSLRTDGFRLSVALVAVFESVMVVLVILRRDSIVTDLSPLAVIAGLLGSFSILGFRPVEGADESVVGQVVQVVGALLQIGGSFSLGRSFGLMPANRGIKTVGLYRLVRHPLYMSYLVTETGYLLNNPSTRNVTVLIIGAGFQVVRIHYEERLLQRDPAYAAYMSTVRWRLIPGAW